MSFELKVPGVGESVTEVEIGSWKVKEGDTVKVDQDLVELLTDKVNQVLPSPVAGVISKILVPVGKPAKVGEVIVLIEVGGKQDPRGGAEGAEKAITPAAQAAEAVIKVMPAAARVLAEQNLKPADFKGSGPGGRLLKEDVLGKVAAAKMTAPTSVAASPSAPSAPPRETDASPSRAEETVRMTPLRRTIARNLLQAQQTAALLTTFNEVDMTGVMDLRAKN